MKVYVCYDCYDSSEWFDIYNVSLSKKDSIKHFKEEDLPNLLNYGPDDCHHFQLQEVKMSPQEYRNFMSLIQKDDSLHNTIYEGELYDIMSNICDSYENIIFETTGCDDNYEIQNLYMSTEHSDVEEESDEYYELLDGFFEDEEMYEKYQKIYIEDNYE